MSAALSSTALARRCYIPASCALIWVQILRFEHNVPAIHAVTATIGNRVTSLVALMGRMPQTMATTKAIDTRNGLWHRHFRVLPNS